jgi:hypothetical protein
MTDETRPEITFKSECECCGRRGNQVRRLIGSIGSRTIPWTPRQFVLCDECILTYVSVLMHDPEDRAWFERELEEIKKRFPEMPP